jgi:hypothetical protein
MVKILTKKHQRNQEESTYRVFPIFRVGLIITTRYFVNQFYYEQIKNIEETPLISSNGMFLLAEYIPKAITKNSP